MNLDETILNLLKKSSSGMTFTEIKNSLGITGLNDATLNNSLKRLNIYGDIQKMLYYNFSERPKVFYLPFESESFYIPTEKEKDPHVYACLRREVRLDDGTHCYYYVFLNCFGEKIDHYLEKIA